MVQSALAADRAVAVLDWVVGHPGEAFTLSELSRALGINIPSAMSVLQSLIEGGYLRRDPRSKAYEPGPAMLAISLIACRQHRAFELLDAELAALAAEVGSECHASVVVGDQTVVVAGATGDRPDPRPIRIGFRWPLMAPVGHIFMAWNVRAEIEAWIARADTPERRVDRDRVAGELATVRRLGFSANRFGRPGYQPALALDQLAAQPRDPALRQALVSAVAAFSDSWEVIVPERGQLYDVSNLSAPVFDSRGNVLMAIIINGFPAIEGGALLAHAERLMAMARLLMKHGNGRYPDEL